MQMDERKRRILRAIIDDYILTGVPVGSRTISKKYETGLSSATIRNEMSDLEELGFLDQPHVSAGRIPSAKAYRLYVDSLLQAGIIPDDSAESVLSHFSGRVHQMEDVIDHAARVLSSLTQYTAVVLSPKGTEPRLQTIQLVPVSTGSALVDGPGRHPGQRDTHQSGCGRRYAVCNFKDTDTGAERLYADGCVPVAARTDPPDGRK